MGTMKGGGGRGELLLLLPLLCATAALALAPPALPHSHKPPPHAQCQQIHIQQCKDLRYNLTSFPNLVGNEDEREAREQLQTFDHLLQIKCSDRLNFFLCSVYVPMCTLKISYPIGPCRRLCESVRSKCEPRLTQFSLPWPAFLNCSKFPENNGPKSLCMGPPEGEEGDSGHHGADRSNPQFGEGNSGGERGVGRAPFAAPAICPQPAISAGHYVYVNRSGLCALRCESEGRFSRAERRTAEIVALVMAICVCVVAVVSLVLVLCSQAKIFYPDTPLLFISASYGLGTIPYFVGGVVGRSGMACVQHSGVNILVVTGLQQNLCTVVGIALYFFHLSAHLWWLVMCWLVFLSKGLNWSPQAIGRWSFWYHFCVWGCSCLAVVLALISQSIDASEVLGMCGVGLGRDTSILYFLIVPQLVILFAAALPLLLSLIVYCWSPENASKRLQRDSSCWVTGVVAAAYLPIGSTLVTCYFLLYRNVLFETEMVKIVIQFCYGLCASCALLARTCCANCTAARPKETKTPLSAIGHYPHQPLSPTPVMKQNNWPAPSSHCYMGN